MALVLTNNGLQNESEYKKTSFYSDQYVYEVIRVIDGVALFLEEHFVRLKKSIQIQQWPFQIIYPDFKQYMAELINQNLIAEGNVRFVYLVREGKIHWVFSFIPHSYPTPDDFLLGVSTDLFFAERENPNAKVIQTGIRDKANQMIKDWNLYEVLLVDRNEMITEGSRSNVFFVKSDVFYTSPVTMILEGVTRQKVVECLKKLDFQLIEQALPTGELSSFDAAFLTGTSPKLLPIRSIGGRVFDVQNRAVKKLMDAYNEMIQEYIGNEKYLHQR